MHHHHHHHHHLSLSLSLSLTEHDSSVPCRSETRDRAVVIVASKGNPEENRKQHDVTDIEELGEGGGVAEMPEHALRRDQHEHLCTAAAGDDS